MNKNELPEKLVCHNCGKKGPQRRLVTRSYGKGANLHVIENIPIITCPQCSERYMTAVMAHEIARIKLHRKS